MRNFPGRNLSHAPDEPGHRLQNCSRLIPVRGMSARRKGLRLHPATRLALYRLDLLQSAEPIVKAL